MVASHDPSRMSPDERRRELVAILAGGVVRLRQLKSAVGVRPESTAARLDVPAKTVLIGCHGLTPGEDAQTRAGQVLVTPGRLSPQPPFNSERACHG